MLTCEQINEEEYALGVLDDARTAAIREHLTTCDRHPQVSEMRAAVMGLAFATDELEPPAPLRDRILRSAALPSRSSRTRRADLLRWTLPLAAGLLFVAAITTWTLSLRDDGSGDDLFVKSFRSESGIEVDLVADFSRPSSIITFARLAFLPAGQEYSAWAIRDGVWLKMGSFRPGDDGHWSGEFVFQLQPDDSLCLTGGPPLDVYNDGQAHPLFIEPLVRDEHDSS